MTTSDSDRVRDLFTRKALDWTPASAAHKACLLYAPALGPEMSGDCASVLSDAELQRADRFLTDEDRANFIQRRAFRRYCGSLTIGSRPLSQLIFEETEQGRPYLSERLNLSFSFSACRSGFLGAWSATHAVGVDIEDKNRQLEPLDLARQFFTDAETKVVEAVHGPARQQVFLQLWCLKEAALKSIGQGLPFGLDAFGFELNPDPSVVRVPAEHGGPERFDAHLFATGEVYAALIVRQID